jgi:hypothetical protein
MSASQSLSRPVIRTAPLAKPLIMTAMTIHSKRIGVRFSWEVPRHGFHDGLRLVIDGEKALAAAVHEVLGTKAADSDE